MRIAGFDEVGRGAWAGPLLVVGVVIKSDSLTDLRDSKSYTAKQRESLRAIVCRNVLSVGLSWVSAEEIDTIGLANSLKRGFKDAAATLEPHADTIIVDGNVDYVGSPISTALIKGDESVPAVAAASIIAKQLRDAYMHQLHSLHPEYEFNRHVGYGTALHKKLIEQHGITRFHRRSFKGVGS